MASVIEFSVCSLCVCVSNMVIVSVPLKVGTCVTLQYIVLQAADRIFTIVPGHSSIFSFDVGHLMRSIVGAHTNSHLGEGSPI